MLYVNDCKNTKIRRNHLVNNNYGFKPMITNFYGFDLFGTP